jgi:hypothetical protein
MFGIDTNKIPHKGALVRFIIAIQDALWSMLLLNYFFIDEINCYRYSSISFNKTASGAIIEVF